MLKDQVKDSIGLGALERQIAKEQPSLGNAEKQQRYLTDLYNLYVDIERKFLRKESKEVDKAEGLVLYTRNQFIREFNRAMEMDESKTMKY